CGSRIRRRHPPASTGSTREARRSRSIRLPASRSPASLWAAGFSCATATQCRRCASTRERSDLLASRQHRNQELQIGGIRLLGGTTERSSTTAAPQRDSNPCFSHDHVFASWITCFATLGALKTGRDSNMQLESVQCPHSSLWSVDNL